MWFQLQILVLQLLISLFSLTFGPNKIKTADQYQLGSTKQQEELLAQLRELTGNILEYDYERTDDFLLRWLRECGMDVKCADKMVHKYKKWRKENRVDSILNETLAEVSSISSGKSCSLDAFDSDGFPVLICETNGLDLRKLLVTGQKERVNRFYLQWAERLMSEARKFSQDNHKICKPGTLLVNAQGFNLKQHGCLVCIEYAREICKIVNNYYPEALELVVVINASPVTLSLVKVLKPSLSSYYQNILKIFSSNKADWSKFLLDIIPSNQLPEKYGGTKPKSCNFCSNSSSSVLV